MALVRISSATTISCKPPPTDLNIGARDFARASAHAPLMRSARLNALLWNSIPAALAASMSPVSSSTSSSVSQMMMSLRSTTETSISRCSGMVEPIETTVAPGFSHSANRIGSSPRERAAVSTMSAPSTASLADATPLAGTPVSAVTASANAVRRSGVGLYTVTSVSSRTLANARVCIAASRPLPSTASRA
ncbi:hypothetical protein D3C76_1240810 [compost metagenome]